MFSSSNLKVSNILWLKYTLSDTPFRFTLKFYFILQISFWVHCFPELYFMRAKRVSVVIEAALDNITSYKTSYSVLNHSPVIMWVLGHFVFFRRAGGWVILWVLQKRRSPDILSPVVGISVNYWYLLNLSWVIISFILVTNHSVPYKAFDIMRRNLMVITLNGCKGNLVV